MADTTHNVTIKATLDTSQIGIQSNGSSQPSYSGGGSSGSSSGLSIVGAAASKAGTSMNNASASITKAGTSIANTIKLLRTAFESITYGMSELNKRVQVISWMYRKTHSTLDDTAGQFKHLSKRVESL